MSTITEELAVNAVSAAGYVPRRACDVMKAARFAEPELLFDEFWREGEIAFAFGEPGSGKSLLAVQIADALARGRPVGHLEMPASRRKVLYVDLVLNDVQFQMRYSRPLKGTSARPGRPSDRSVRPSRIPYKFSRNLWYERPPDDIGLVEWLRSRIAAEGFEAVIVDDLSAISRSDDGTRERLDLMIELRRLTRDVGVSVLVLDDSHPRAHGRKVSEDDLRRSRILCAYADSVFAIGGRTRSDRRIIVQTRSKANELRWTHGCPVRALIGRREDGLLGFEIDEPTMDEERSRLIGDVVEMHDSGMTFREIADELGISKSTAQRLEGLWPSVLHASRSRYGVEEAAAEDSHQPVPPPDRNEIVDHRAIEAASGPVQTTTGDELMYAAASDGPPPCDSPVWQEIPLGAGLIRHTPNAPPARAPRQRTVYDLPVQKDGYGRDIYVERKQEYDGRPLVWYRIKNNGRLTRYVRENFGVYPRDLGHTVLLE